MFRLRRSLGPLDKSEEGFLQDVLGLAMAQAQRPAIQEQAGGFGMVQSFAPPALLVINHEFHWIDTPHARFV